MGIYTVTGPERLSLLLVTPTIYKAYEVNVTADAIQRQTWKFRQLLQQPSKDPRQAGQQLYDWLFGPLVQDLEELGAQTLLWSLDDTLRYVPIAALHDGQQYVAERWRTGVFTTQVEKLATASSAPWRVAGLGVSKAQADFPALPHVPAELAGIVKSAQTTGVWPGMVALDEAFTPAVWAAALRETYPVVHVASHFKLQPGDETQSYLLLGDGSHLNLEELQGDSFGEVELLTFSACHTGFGDNQKGSHGVEVESFAMVAQERGAKAVIASLWAVWDGSTAVWMREFYQRRAAEPGLSKWEALRQAQLALLRGEVKSAGAEGQASPSQLSPEALAVQAPEFPHDPKAPYAHPYYWAPFFLVGNGL